MGTSIALLSGESGSGKTTIAVGIAKILSKCGVSVLLVDCDIKTHGATYIFNRLLKTSWEKWESKPGFKSLSFLECLVHPINLPMQRLFCVENNFYFMPSVLGLKTLANNFSANTIAENIKILTETFEVTIFDFQTGYDSTTESVLPNIDCSLLVIERNKKNISNTIDIYEIAKEQYADCNTLIEERNKKSISITKDLYKTAKEYLSKQNTYSLWNKLVEGKNNLDVICSDINFPENFPEILPSVYYCRYARGISELNEPEDLNIANTNFESDMRNVCEIILPQFATKIHDEKIKRSISELEAKRKEIWMPDFFLIMAFPIIIFFGYIYFNLTEVISGPDSYSNKMFGYTIGFILLCVFLLKMSNKFWKNMEIKKEIKLYSKKIGC